MADILSLGAPNFSPCAHDPVYLTQMPKSEGRLTLLHGSSTSTSFDAKCEQRPLS